MVATQDVRALLSDGIEIAKTGDRRLAHALLVQATELDPNNERGWLWLAGVAYDEDEAVRCLTQVLALNPENEEAHRRLARFGRTEPAQSAGSPPFAGRGSEYKPAAETEVGPGEESRMEPDEILETLPRLKTGSGAEANRTHGRMEAQLDVLTSEVNQDQSSATLVDLTEEFVMPSQSEPSDRPVRILVVDDSPTIRKLVAMALEKLGYEVLAAADGMEALARINDDIPDLIFLDITMPRMDGYQLCRTIKNNHLTEHIPIVMLTGKDGLIDKVRGRIAGSEGYLTKPFRPDELVRMVQQHIRR